MPHSFYDFASAIGAGIATAMAPGTTETPHPLPLAQRPQISRTSHERYFEWFSSYAMIVWGVILGLPGNTFSQASFIEFAERGMTEVGLAWVFAGVGAARAIALFINGRNPRTPMVRMLGALVGAVLWGQVAWLFGQSVTTTGVVTTGAGIYGLMALFELLCIRRAAYDARYQHP